MNRCRLGLHRWKIEWDDKGTHRACSRCGVRATAGRRMLKIGSAALVVCLSAAALTAAVYVLSRPEPPPPNYSVAKSVRCFRGRDFKVWRSDRRAHRAGRVEVEVTTPVADFIMDFTRSPAVASRLAHTDYRSSLGPGPVYRNVAFNNEGGLASNADPVLACLQS